MKKSVTLTIPFNSDDIQWPEEMASLGELKTPGFWKRVIWKRVMYLNQKKRIGTNLVI
jgi:hypothetical protein